MAFDAPSELDFDLIDSVTLEEGDIAPQKEGNSEPTTDQKNRKTLLRVHDDIFEDFHHEIEFLLRNPPGVYETADERWSFLTDKLDVPDFLTCRNCRECGQMEDGTYFCEATREMQDGSWMVKTVDPDTRPHEFCPEEDRSFRFPEDRVSDLAEHRYEYLVDGFEEKVNKERERYEERRQEAIEEGRDHSWYVQNDLEDMLTSEEEHVSYELSKILMPLLDPTSTYRSFRNKALEWAWMENLSDSPIRQKFYPQTAEAYLRSMDSPVAKELKPGEGGVEFEKEVREFLKKQGFPMRPTLFDINGEVSTSRKEADIHTEIGGKPTLIEVFTYGAHSHKDRQLRDYLKLYELAEGAPARGVRMTDATSHLQITVELLETLASINQGAVQSIPGDYRSNTVDSRDRDGKVVSNVGEACTYSCGSHDFYPGDETKEVENQVARLLRQSGYNPIRPLIRENEFRYYPLGPTIAVQHCGYEFTLVFHGPRPSEEIWEDEDEAPIDNEYVIEPPRRWKAPRVESTLGTPNVLPVELRTDKEEQSELSPLVFDFLIQNIHKPDSQ